jgi:tetratricopeptide (TPR) repeat protein
MRIRPFFVRCALLPVLLHAAFCPALESAAGALVAAAPPRCDRDQVEQSPRARAACVVLWQRARDRHQAGDYSGACDTLQLAYSLWPDPELLYNWAVSARLQGDCERARKLYREYLTLGPSAAGQSRAEQALGRLGECNALSDEGTAGADEGVSGSVSPAMPASEIPLSARIPLLPIRPEPVRWLQATGSVASPEEPRVAVPEALPWALGGAALAAGITAGYFVRRVAVAAERIRQADAYDGKLNYWLERGPRDQRRAAWFGASAALLGAGAALTWVLRERSAGGAELRVTPAQSADGRPLVQLLGEF